MAASLLDQPVKEPEALKGEMSHGLHKHGSHQGQEKHEKDVANLVA
jgi:hypothetical protein